MTWNPQLYLRFGDERSQPFFDLVHRLPAIDGPVRAVVDLGCGPGTLTATLCDRFPDATVLGVDSSAEMIAAAGAATASGRAGPRLRFERGDAVGFAAEDPVDVLISNAALQWIDGHLEHLPHWLEQVRPGGVFAFQVPGNFSSPSHRSFAELVRSPRWRDRIDPAVLERPRSAEPEAYLERLLSSGAVAQVWETTYLHVLQGPDPVLHWIRATALRPVLAALDPADVGAFEAELAARLAQAYPPGPHGTVFPFRRIFAVAVRT
ncbi:MAG: methyltransferase domain-containing protein [Acidimicrobiales bacterium]|nr:methyltransferase domain-containing protein [Acidimicrobiales bacterium]